jgi:hypothetical protein
VREYFTAIGAILMIAGALGTAFSVYHLQSARREFIAQFHLAAFVFAAMRKSSMKGPSESFAIFSEQR